MLKDAKKAQDNSEEEVLQTSEETQQTSDNYMSPFRRSREQSIGLAIKTGKKTPKNELDKVHYQNYKVKKLSAKVAKDQEKSKLKPLSMRTMSLKNNPKYGENPNSKAYIKSLSAQAQPTAFQNFAGQFMNSFSKNKPISTKNMNNTLREQRLKLLQDESFLQKNAKLSQFIFSQNRDSILKNQIEQMNKENELRRSKVKPNMNDVYGKATKANAFKFEKNKNEVKNSNNNNYNNNNDSDYYEDGDYDERDNTLRMVNKMPNFKDAKQPEVFKQSDVVKNKEVKSVDLSAKIEKPVELSARIDQSGNLNTKFEKIDESGEDEPDAVVRKLAINKEESTIDWDEMDREEEQYKITLDLQKKLRSILGLKNNF